MSSTQDMNLYKANRDYLLDLHDKKRSIDESYKPIAWFDVKHECEGPGLMNEITPNKISSRSWGGSSIKWCILSARRECVKMYNASNASPKVMPYFAIFKNSDGKFQWAIFNISDKDFNDKSDKTGDYSSIEMENGNLEMNISFKEQKDKPLTFTDINKIYVPSNYTINSGTASCVNKVKKTVSNCNKIKRKKKSACKIAKAGAITENERNIQSSLLDDVNAKMEGMTTFEDASKKLHNNIKRYSRDGKWSSRYKMTRSRSDKNKISREISTMLKRPPKFPFMQSYYNETKKKYSGIKRKWRSKLNSYRGDLRNKRNSYAYKGLGHGLAASRAKNSKLDYTRKANCSDRKSRQKVYKYKPFPYWRWKEKKTPKVRCGFVGSHSNDEIIGYQSKNSLGGYGSYDTEHIREGIFFGGGIKGKRRRRNLKRRTRSLKKLFGKSKKKISRTIRRKIGPKINKSRTARHQRYHKNKYNDYNNGVINSENKRKRYTGYKNNARNDYYKYRNRLNRSYQGFTNKREGFDNNVVGCNNQGVDANFEISHDNSIHNCDSENIYTKYSSADHKHTIRVPENKSFTLADNLLVSSKITPSLFTNDLGDCNNGTYVIDQKLELNYSINHEKENINIIDLSIDNSARQTKGGLLTYKNTPDNSGPHQYIISNKSSNNEEVNIRLDGNGNVKINKSVIFTNPLQNDIKLHIKKNGYTSKNNLQQLKSGDEIRSEKYRVTLGTSWNNSTLFYKTKNITGNNGGKDLHRQLFKYTESYHKNKGSTDTNVFILYKIKTHGLPKLLYEHRIYANIEKTSISDCNTSKGSKNLCYVRAINDKLVGDEELNETENVNLKTVNTITMDEFKTDTAYASKYIDNSLIGKVPKNINEIRIFLINSLKDIHNKISATMKNGASEGFSGYSNDAFRGYSTIEGLTLDASGNHDFDDNDEDGIRRNITLLDEMRKQDNNIDAKTVKMKSNADAIRSKLTKLTGYDVATSIHGGTIAVDGDYNDGNKYDAVTGTGALLRTHDDYDDNNTLIPFIYDKSSGATDFYKTDSGNLDPKAKIDAIEADLNEMLYQQNTLYTIGSITSATFIITAILLARNSS